MIDEITKAKAEIRLKSPVNIVQTARTIIKPEIEIVNAKIAVRKILKMFFIYR